MIVIASPASKNYSELSEKFTLNWTKIVLNQKKTTKNSLSGKNILTERQKQ